MKRVKPANAHRRGPTVSHSRHKNPKPRLRTTLVCALCGQETAGVADHIYKHLQKDLQEHRYHCQYPDCDYRNYHHGSFDRHLRKHRSDKKLRLDRKEELKPHYETMYSKCFGAAKSPPVKKVRGKSLRDDLLSVHRKSTADAGNSSLVTKKRGSSLGNPTRRGQVRRSIINDNKKMQFVHYMVTPHDYLGYIAAYHGTTTEKLKEINDLPSDTLTPGQIILVPRLSDVQKDGTMNAAPGKDQENNRDTPKNLSNAPVTSDGIIVKEEVVDEERVGKIRALNRLPKVGTHSLVICGFCEKDVLPTIVHVYQHMSNEFEKHRFLCLHPGCNFGSYTSQSVLKHQKKVHKCAAKKMVLDRVKAIEAETQEYAANWLGLELKTKKTAAVVENEGNEPDDNDQEVEMENEAQPADYDGELQGGFDDGGAPALPYDEPEDNTERDDGHVTITTDFMNDIVVKFLDDELPSKATVESIIAQAKELLEKEPNMVEIKLEEDQTLTVCGDLHGQLYDLTQILMNRGDPNEKRLYLFNGDFVDRGTQGVEVMLVLLGYKIIYPNSVFLNRGNHESTAMNHIHGFEKEVREKYDYRTFCSFQALFNALPLCHLVDKRVFICHGGLCQKEGVTLADIQAINRFVQPPNSGIMCDLLWADPQNEWGSRPNDRGTSHYFGPDITRKWCVANSIQYIIRSHEQKKKGWGMQEGGLCYTVFSASNYGGRGNQGAYVVLSPGFLMPGIESFVVDDEVRQEAEFSDEEEEEE